MNRYMVKIMDFKLRDERDQIRRGNDIVPARWVSSMWVTVGFRIGLPGQVGLGSDVNEHPRIKHTSQSG